MWAKGLLADRTRGGQLHGTRSLEGLQLLFEEDLAQVTKAVTRSKAGAARGKATEQSPQGPTPPPTQPAPSIPPPPPPLQPTTGAPLQSKSRPQLSRQAPSAEHPGPFPFMIDQVAEVLRDMPRLVQRHKEDARLGPIGNRLEGGATDRHQKGRQIIFSTTTTYSGARLRGRHLRWSFRQH